MVRESGGEGEEEGEGERDKEGGKGIRKWKGGLRGVSRRKGSEGEGY